MSLEITTTAIITAAIMTLGVIKIIAAAEIKDRQI
jgi:hypothetical protein